MEEEGYVYLSAAGDLLYRAWKEQSRVEEAAWPEPSANSPDEKIGLSDEEHHRPKGWRRCVKELADCPYVDYIRYDGKGPKAPCTSRIISHVPESGRFHIVYSDDTYALPMIVETTARGEGQMDLVEGRLKEILRGQ